ncbi:MAG: YiiX/YebB-like N1pC/P60 family cysteine hydrolase [Bdellovibrionota bacterium]
MKNQIKLFLIFNIFAQASVATANEKIGVGGLALPPVFSNKAKDTLIDVSKSLIPSQKSLKEVSKKFKNGDVIFIRSTSMQSKALEEVTGSKWTHVGILFRVNILKNGKAVLLADKADPQGGQWVVYEAGPRVRFNPVDNFVGKKAFAVQRPQKELNSEQVEKMFSVALTRLGRPYDIYFLLSHDGITRDDAEYCSELVWYVYAKAIGLQLGYQVQIASQKLSGPEAQKLIKDRLGRKSSPLSVDKWKQQYVIPPEAQFLSPHLIRIDQ